MDQRYKTKCNWHLLIMVYTLSDKVCQIFLFIYLSEIVKTVSANNGTWSESIVISIDGYNFFIFNPCKKCFIVQCDCRSKSI